MKAFHFAVAAALLAVPATGFGALINGDAADQFVGGPSTSGPQDGTGTSVGNPGGFTLKVGRIGGDNSNAGRNVVYVFQLPNLGAVANPFAAASLSFGVGAIDGNTNVDADLYGLARRDAAPNIVNADYYFGNSADPTDATRLQVDIMTGAGTAANSIVSTDATGNANLAAFLNSQYAAGAGIGEYVYLRLNVDGAINNAVRGFNVHTANETDTAKRPVITYTAIPEPASLMLLAIGSLASIYLRRPR